MICVFVIKSWCEIEILENWSGRTLNFANLVRLQLGAQTCCGLRLFENGDACSDGNLYVQCVDAILKEFVVIEKLLCIVDLHICYYQYADELHVYWFVFVCVVFVAFAFVNLNVYCVCSLVVVPKLL